MSKAKGARAERELQRMFHEKNFGTVRVAGSGSATIPAPDLLVGNGSRVLAIECKSLKNDKKYITKEQIKELKEFARRFGAEPWLGIRFDNKGWYFLKHEDFKKSEKSFIMSLELARKKGLSFDELIK
jgi:Holliday junction resolvase